MPAQFDLTLMIAEINGGLGVTFHYNSDLFDRVTMERMLAHFATLLAGIAADPKRPLSTIPLLSAAEQKQLTLSQNQTKVAYPYNDAIHQLIEKQTEQTPDAIAILVPKTSAMVPQTSAVCKESSVTYDQLNRRANQLAFLLQKKGIAPGSLVGIYMDRSVDMVVGLLGILKAGGAYIPLDPAFPKERLALMLADAQPTLILTQQHLNTNLQTLSDSNKVPKTSANIICLDNHHSLYEQPETNLAVNVQVDNLAYVIYTSGSTGRPKGVMVSHRNVVNFLASMQNEPGLTASDTLLAVTTLSFDIAGLELFLPLTVGAKLIIATAAEASDGLRLQEIMSDSSVTVMQATPATWQLLLEAGWTGKVPKTSASDKLKILCGGEALPRKLANRLLERSRELWNMYGPTETTIWSTIYPVAPGDGPVPIGLPIANTQIYVLDKQMQPVPQGVVGDLYIGGDGVAQGYFKQPELTAEKFILHSFMVPTGDREPRKTSASSSVILYKSGDKARLLSDGNLLFLGRDDHQVKVRGYRIELGDIESALEQYPAVKQAVVIARDDDQQGADRVPKTSANLGQNKQLAGYLVLHKDADPTPTDTLRAFLREKLPEYMIPAAFVILDTVPLTPNGKIDRKSLPATSQSRPELNATYVAPRTPLEEQLAEICADLLGLDKVGIYDNFFDLGGNSLLATRFIFQAREALQVQLPLYFLFADSTVSGLSKAVMAVQKAGADTGTVGARQPSLFEEMSVAELNAEAVLDKSIPNPDLPLASIKTPEHILLTGATGFVGAFLLNDLLTKTKAHVHCLVRAETDAAGKERLRQNLETYNLWQEHFAGRISVVPGDLAQKRLRLTPRQFDDLAQQIDVIYHNGATVNFVYSYRTLKGSNILGTQEVLRLAGRYKLKAVHFVSTLSVLHTGAHDDGAVYFENDDLDQIGAPFGGYAKSKWVAEKLVVEAGRRGMPVAIYRPGLISGDSETGVTNTSDMMSSLMQVCLTTGTVPDLDIMVDIVPVNYVSGAIVQLSLHSDFANQVFHLSNPQRMHYHEMIEWFKSTGYAIESIPFATWRDNLINLAAQFGGGGWDAFLPLLEEADAKQAFMPAFDCQNSLAGLAGSDIIYTPVDADLLRKYLEYFERSGFI
jgi:amino acid adenylation domain-containing protein/thioester reductase-like protein